ncbi:MAG: acyl-CoA dehydrogenase family protein [Oligoflexia bacterium]|nr:acyl-CoA dehydrogenase family protein [Oligoflexia bacterium]
MPSAASGPEPVGDVLKAVSVEMSGPRIITANDGRWGQVVSEEFSYAQAAGSFITGTEALVADAARTFCNENMAPQIRAWEQAKAFPVDLLRVASQSGLINMAIPEAYGGPGLSVRAACIATAEIAACCAAAATTFAANDLALKPILLAGTEAQKDEFVRALIARQGLASFCLTEPDAGSNPAELRTSVREDGSDLVINGAKQWITNSGIAELLVVFVREPGTQGNKGIRCVLIPTKTSGVSIGKPEAKMGQHASYTGAITFTDVRVPKSNLLDGDGFKIAMRTLDYSRPVTAAIGLGICMGSLEDALPYALTRVQGGKPIAEHQLIQRRIAIMSSLTLETRLLVLQSASLLDLGQPSTHTASVAKYRASTNAVEVADHAVQILGGYGYSGEYGPEKRYRDARVLPIYEGTTEIQELVIAREALRPYRNTQI